MHQQVIMESLASARTPGVWEERAALMVNAMLVMEWCYGDNNLVPLVMGIDHVVNSLWKWSSCVFVFVCLCVFMCRTSQWTRALSSGW